MPANADHTVTPLEYRIRADELRREALLLTSASARRRASAIAEKFEMLAGIAKNEVLHFDDLD